MRSFFCHHPTEKIIIINNKEKKTTTSKESKERRKKTMAKLNIKRNTTVIFGHISYPKTNREREQKRNKFTYDNATVERKESQYARKLNNKVYQQYFLEKKIDHRFERK